MGADCELHQTRDHAHLSLPQLPGPGTQDMLEKSLRVYGKVNVRAKLWKSQAILKSRQSCKSSSRDCDRPCSRSADTPGPDSRLQGQTLIKNSDPSVRQHFISRYRMD